MLATTRLSKIYYKNPTAYETEYHRRFNDGIKLPFETRAGQLFYLPPHKLLQDIQKNNATIQKLKAILPTEYATERLIDEMISTNQIEGIHSTRKDIKKALNGEANKFKYLSHAYLELESFSPIESPADIRELYDDIIGMEIDDKPDGELFRKEAVSVVTATQKVIHTGTLPESAIYDKLSEMLDYLNEDTDICKIAIAHYLFGYIHPFYDGNGRTSRFLSSIYLKDVLEPLTALTLSYGTSRLSSLYYGAFESVNDPKNKGEATEFVEVFCQIILEAQDTIIHDLLENPTP